MSERGTSGQLFPKDTKERITNRLHPSAVIVSSLGMLEHELYCGKTNCASTDLIWLFICCINGFFLFIGSPWLSSLHSFSLHLPWWHHTLQTQNKEIKWTATLMMPSGSLREDVEHSHSQQEGKENVRKNVYTW